jgi:DNA (cytosine-5)-methyltransferase 1
MSQQDNGRGIKRRLRNTKMDERPDTSEVSEVPSQPSRTQSVSRTVSRTTSRAVSRSASRASDACHLSKADHTVEVAAPQKSTDFVRFVDLFCGIGAFHIATKRVDPLSHAVFACDTSENAREVYRSNFGGVPEGDVRSQQSLPAHDILFAGFPCQSFSIIGKMQGFEDANNGDLFFEVARLLKVCRPALFVLENVKKLITHDGGRTMQTMVETLQSIGYHVTFRLLNALDYGLPQLRQRVFIVGMVDKAVFDRFRWPDTYRERATLESLLDPIEAGAQYNASERVVEMSRTRAGEDAMRYPGRRTIWYTCKSGKTSVRDYSRTLRSEPSYNYLLVDGLRRPTEGEMLRLQGFPSSFDMSYAKSYTAKRHLLGNTIPVPVAEAVVRSLLEARKCGV